MAEELNVRRLLCPMPVIRTQNRVKDMANGEELLVVGTDPGMLNDVPTWCRINGHEVIESGSKDNEYHVHLKVQHS